MSNDFIRLYDATYPGSSYLVNINSISLVWVEMATIVISGVHGENNGLLYITQESHSRLLAAIEKRLITDQIKKEANEHGKN